MGAWLLGAWSIESHMASSSSLRSLSSGGFQWPWQYHFPPFFTVQVNSDTRAKQLEAWCQLVLDFHRARKSYVLDTNEAQSSPLFSNEELNRILSLSDDVVQLGVTVELV